jgi:peptidoglycan hydrolase-like protein with peptidoglycan-binding domain
VDGVWGPATQAGVRSYQQQHNLNATGRLDQDTLSAMNLAPQQPASQRYGSNYNPPPDTSNPQPNRSTTNHSP